MLIGLVYGELPFMVLPVYAALERFDWKLMEAAQDLYASKLQAFVHVMLPLTSAGIITGSVLVFVPTVGSFVVPELLGGSKVAMLGNQLERQFEVGPEYSVRLGHGDRVNGAADDPDHLVLPQHVGG